MDKYLDEKIKKLEILLDRDALSTYGGGMLDAYKDVKRQLALNTSKKLLRGTKTKQMKTSESISGIAASVLLVALILFLLLS